MTSRRAGKFSEGARQNKRSFSFPAVQLIVAPAVRIQVGCLEHVVVQWPRGPTAVSALRKSLEDKEDPKCFE
jgi:hypothetical protein